MNLSLVLSTSQSWLPSILGVGIWVALVLLMAEWVSRQGTFDGEIPRKIVHIGTGNVILLAWWLHTPLSLGVGASIIFCIVTLISYRFPILSSVSGIGRQSWGTFFYALSIGLLFIYFWGRSLPQFAAIGILVMTWGDGLAAIIGKKYGTHKYRIWGMEKSWEGSATMLLVSTVICGAIITPIYSPSVSIGPLIVLALLSGTFATGLEAFSKYGLDNLTVPVGTAGLCYSLVLWQL